jgi:hypothetical protein
MFVDGIRTRDALSNIVFESVLRNVASATELPVFPLDTLHGNPWPALEPS